MSVLLTTRAELRHSCHSVVMSDQTRLTFLRQLIIITVINNAYDQGGAITFLLSDHLTMSDITQISDEQSTFVSLNVQLLQCSEQTMSDINRQDKTA